MQGGDEEEEEKNNNPNNNTFEDFEYFNIECPHKYCKESSHLLKV